MTMPMNARRKQIELTRLDIKINHYREHHADCKACIDGKYLVDNISRELLIDGDLSDGKRLLQIAEPTMQCTIRLKFSPI
ncbi:hypothetical protein JY446_24085 [Serratia marcescens]|nr:hypothetical protein [Serratia marcescens]